MKAISKKGNLVTRASKQDQVCRRCTTESKRGGNHDEEY